MPQAVQGSHQQQCEGCKLIGMKQPAFLKSLAIIRQPGWWLPQSLSLAVAGALLTWGHSGNASPATDPAPALASTAAPALIIAEAPAILLRASATDRQNFRLPDASRDRGPLHTAPRQQFRAPERRPLPRINQHRDRSALERNTPRHITPAPSLRERRPMVPPRMEPPSDTQRLRPGETLRRRPLTDGLGRDLRSDRYRRKMPAPRPDIERRRPEVPRIIPEPSDSRRIVCIRGIVRGERCYCLGSDVPRRIGPYRYVCITRPDAEP